MQIKHEKTKEWQNLVDDAQEGPAVLMLGWIEGTAKKFEQLIHSGKKSINKKDFDKATKEYGLTGWQASGVFGFIQKYWLHSEKLTAETYETFF